MNMGLCEGEALGSTLHKILREGASLRLLDSYERDHQQKWRALLGLSGGLQPANRANSWVAQRCAKILPCLPAQGADLSKLAGQLELAPA
jgi:2-polyprenyl-6-methoxyphenol hydroxylase-like FAD-dependent oxidoreductase